MTAAIAERIILHVGNIVVIILYLGGENMKKGITLAITVFLLFAFGFSLSSSVPGLQKIPPKARFHIIIQNPGLAF